MSFPFLRALVSASVVSFFSVVSVEAQDAPGKTYATIGIGNIDISSFDDTGTVAMVARGGIDFNRWLAAEVEGQIGLSDQTTASRAGGEFEYGSDWMFGIYGVAKVPVTKRASLFIRAGYAAVDFNESFSRIEPDGRVFTRSDEEVYNGLALGLGGRYMFGASGKNGIRLDSYVIADFDDGDPEGSIVRDTIAGFNISYIRKF